MRTKYTCPVCGTIWWLHHDGGGVAKLYCPQCGRVIADLTKERGRDNLKTERR